MIHNEKMPSASFYDGSIAYKMWHKFVLFFGKTAPIEIIYMIFILDLHPIIQCPVMTSTRSLIEKQQGLIGETSFWHSKSLKQYVTRNSRQHLYKADQSHKRCYKNYFSSSTKQLLEKSYPWYSFWIYIRSCNSCNYKLYRKTTRSEIFFAIFEVKTSLIFYRYRWQTIRL